MITRHSAQIILVVLWVSPSAATTARSVFSRPSIEYMMVCLQAVLAVLHPLAYMLRHALSGLRLAIISNCRQTRSISELIRASLVLFQPRLEEPLIITKHRSLPHE